MSELNSTTDAASLFLNCSKIYLKFTILTILSGIQYTHNVVQSLPPFLSKNFSSSQTETLHPLNSNSPFSMFSAPGNLYFTFVCMNLCILDTSYK